MDRKEAVLIAIEILSSHSLAVPTPINVNNVIEVAERILEYVIDGKK